MNEHLLDQAIRKDMEWILNAPSLLADHPLLWQPDALKTLNVDDVVLPKTQLATLHRGKLGTYFEQLVGILFASHPSYEVLAQNRVIQQQHITLGEIDLLIRDLRTNKILHLELALKFYLQVPESEQPALAWIGSGLKDFFHKKLNRLYHHQLCLPRIAQDKACWPDDLPFPDEHLLWIPGRLYSSAYRNTQALVEHAIDGTPWHINPAAEHSLWFEDTLKPTETTSELTKAGWLRGRSFREQHRGLPAQFSHPNYPLPVYVLPTNWQTNAQTALKNYVATL